MTSDIRFTSWLAGVLGEVREAMTIQQAIHAIIERFKDIIPHQTIAILVLNQDTNNLNIMNSRYISHHFAKSFSRNIGVGIISRVLLKHETVRLAGLDRGSAEYAEVMLENDFDAACLTPILQTQRAIGYLHCDRTDAGPFSDAEALQMEVICGLIGLLMEKFELRAEAYHLARVDSASKALKYDAFIEEYQRELVRARVHQAPVSLLFLDVDNYGRFIATCGIESGHALLEEITRLSRERVREIDIVGRFSADEFMICMGGIGKDQAVRILDDIRRAVQDQAGAKFRSPVSLSGVALTLNSASDLDIPFESIVKALGSGLLAMRSQGQNRICSVDPPHA